jgi:uncharacterized delta-60 repeat protein
LIYIMSFNSLNSMVNCWKTSERKRRRRGAFLTFGEQWISAFALLAILVFNSAQTASGADPMPGTVDLTFDTGSGPDGPVTKVLVQADGRIVIAGLFKKVNGVSRPGIARLNSDGTLDTTFNPGLGIPFLPDSNAVFEYYSTRFLAQQSDGKIIASGAFGSYDGVNRPGAVRINVNGSIDLTFNPPSSASGVTALLPDGKMIASKYLVRLNSDGSIDSSFPATPKDLRVLVALPLDMGKLVVIRDAPRTTFYRQLYWLEQDGSQFTSPEWYFDVFQGVRDALARHNNGGVLLASYGQVVRYTENGSVDTNFVSIKPTTFGQYRRIQCMAVQPDGKIVVGGALYSSDARLARLNADGSLDTTFNSPPDFGSNTNAPGYTNVVSDLALQIDGKILVAGNFLTIDGSTRPYVGRLIGDPTGPPFISNQPKGQTVMEGQSVSFSVLPAGALPVTYQWLFNSAAIPGGQTQTLIWKTCVRLRPARTP